MRSEHPGCSHFSRGGVSVGDDEGELCKTRLCVFRWRFNRALLANDFAHKLQSLLPGLSQIWLGVISRVLTAEGSMRIPAGESGCNENGHSYWFSCSQAKRNYRWHVHAAQSMQAQNFADSSKIFIFRYLFIRLHCEIHLRYGLSITNTMSHNKSRRKTQKQNKQTYDFVAVHFFLWK